MGKALATLGILVAAALAPVASAAVISATGNGADQVFNADGSSIWVGQAEMRVGSTGNANTLTSAGIFVFQLPAIPAGEEVVSASFSATVIGGSDWRALKEKGLDLYGLRVSSVATVLAADHFTGLYGSDATDATPIQENLWFQPNEYNGGMDPTQLGPRRTSATGEANLGAWLNSVYTADANAAGKYVFLRVNSHGDIGTSSSRYWSLASMNNGTVTNRPTLTLTTGVVPEPGALVLLGAGLVMLQMRRRAR